MLRASVATPSITSRSRATPTRDVRAVAEELLAPAGQAIERRLERRMPLRIHPVPVERD